MVLAHAPCHGNAQQLFEEQDYMPVKLGRALHVTALPRLLHQDRHRSARHEALPLQISLVAHHQDWHLTAAAFPAGACKKWTKKIISKSTVIIVVMVTVDGWACARCLCAVFPFLLRCVGADWRIRAHGSWGLPPHAAATGLQHYEV